MLGRLTGRSDGQRAFDRCQLICLDEAGMGDICNIAATGLKQTNGILGLASKKLIYVQLSPPNGQLTPKQYPIAATRSHPMLDFISFSTRWTTGSTRSGR